MVVQQMSLTVSTVPSDLNSTICIIVVRVSATIRPSVRILVKQTVSWHPRHLKRDKEHRDFI